MAWLSLTYEATYQLRTSAAACAMIFATALGREFALFTAGFKLIEQSTYSHSRATAYSSQSRSDLTVCKKV